MVTKDDQEGRVQNAVVPTTQHTTAETAGPGAEKTRTDDSWKQNFPQAAQANASREAYQQTADEQRVQAERAANMELAAEKEEERKATVEGDPIPTGEGENPHSQEPATDPDGDSPAKPDVDSPPNREPPQ